MAESGNIQELARIVENSLDGPCLKERDSFFF
jgi:hypothetical protein